MPKFAANISFLFTDLPLVDRIYAAREHGFSGVEILFPYDDPVPEITRALTICGLPLVLMNVPPPNYTGGERGFAAIPGGSDRFRHDFARALRFATALKAQKLHIMAGVAEGPAARATFVENLRHATAAAPGLTLTIEPINQGDMPGYFLSDFDLAAEIIAEVAAPNLALQFDAYHAQKITGDAFAVWDRHGHLARHIQIAGLPDRHEPVAGAVDYPAFFRMLDAQGYDGWVSAEYHPAGATEDGLGWRP
ncbi:hydroxypyruvate isomerase [Oceanicola sp. 22II-s10i]|uniref:hydroxypyruvate isomerase family protein n=1 Tax=Oceanicola sp. 22II-s10i TaxID=1317116 RepID=UPI000B5235C1|nr:TIM barrel protein [Oceanicola sp. 22II-s10i]OWU86292.1 hydroxypyruvate isomerase [Oceanicola sp. 22II-s10i]